MSSSDVHAGHPALIARLKRAGGHLHPVIERLEAGRPCLDVAQHLRAVESAVTNAKRALIPGRVDHCHDAEGVETGRAEPKAISGYL